ncbi:MAG: lytic transglycosylase domain-containing protein [Clostridia bacterium]|nr:lytic transglycosylase domain-containing protein [Clostridia bacterium]
MRSSLKRFIIIAVILVISILLGFIVDIVWKGFEKKAHPNTYLEYVRQYAYEYNIPEPVIFAMIKVESDFDPQAESYAGACGLMQIMPKTFEWLTSDEHLGEHLHKNEIFDAEVNIRYGTYYLNYLYLKFDRNLDTALAAYNAGEGNVAKWLEDEEYSDGKGNLIKIPFEETEKYVKKVNNEIDAYKKYYYKDKNEVNEYE